MRRAALALPLLALVTGPASAEQAEYLYRLHCSGCHRLDGTGSKPGGIPPFQGILGHFLRAPEGRAYLVKVPGVVNAALPDDDTARVLNYVVDTFATKDAPKNAAPFTAAEVSTLRARHVDDILAERRRLQAKLKRSGHEVGY